MFDYSFQDLVRPLVSMFMASVFSSRRYLDHYKSIYCGYLLCSEIKSRITFLPKSEVDQITSNGKGFRIDINGWFRTVSLFCNPVLPKS